MAHNYTKGSQIIGDLKGADDSNRDTLIDFEEDRIDLKTAGATRFKISGSNGEITFNEQYTFPISDGNTNQVLTTDGVGNLTFKTQATGNGANPPGGTNRQIQFNDNGSFAGNYKILIDDNFNLKASGSLIAKESIGVGTDLGGGRNTSDQWVSISAPQHKFHVIGDIHESANFSIDTAANSTGGSYWSFAKARGTPASPAGVSTNDEIARIQFFAHTGTSALKRSALILAQTDSDGDGRLKFYVTKDGDVDNVAIECYNNQVTIQDQMVIGSAGIIPLSNGGASIGGSSNRFDYMRANNLVAYESLQLGGTHPIYDKAGFGLSINKNHLPIGNYTSGEGLAYISNSSAVENVIFALHKTGSHFGGMAINGSDSDNDEKVVFFSERNTAGFEWRNNVPDYGANGMGNLSSTGTVLMELNANGSLTLGAITIPKTDGTSGQVLKTDGSGALTWQDESGGVSVETLNTITNATGDVTHDCSNSNVFYHSSIAGNFTPNFTQITINNNQTSEASLILAQGGTGYKPQAFKVNGTDTTLYWEGGETPTPATNKIDTINLRIIKMSNAYSVFAKYNNAVQAGGGSGVSIPNNAVLFLDASDPNSYGGSGTTWTDLSGQNKHATLVNSPAFSNSDKWFDFTGGSSHHATLPSGFADFTNGATYFFVADLDSGDHWERLLDFSGGSSTPINVGRKQSGTTMKMEYFNPSKTGTESNIILNNTLASYCITTDGTNAKFYRNGSLISTNSFNKTPDNNTRTQNYIGRSRNGGDAYFDGQLAVVGIFNRDLSASEITDLHGHYDTIYSL